MEHTLQIPDQVKKTLGGKGRKMHTHEIHLKRLEDGKVLARHTLADRQGNPPQDGQRSEKEFALNSPEELAAHIQQHMGPMEPDEDDQEQA